MINKQKLWFLTLFSLILVLSVYYITMPSEVLTMAKTNNKKNSETKVNINNDDLLTALELEKDEERQTMLNEYNEILTSKESTDEEKNNAYDGLKEMDQIKSKEEAIKNKIKDEFKLDSFIKMDSDNVMITIKKKEHNYSLANKIMRCAQKELKDKKYISVKFQN